MSTAAKRIGVGLYEKGTFYKPFSQGFYIRGTEKSYTQQSDHIELKVGGTWGNTISLVTDQLIDFTSINKVSLACSVEGIVDSPYLYDGGVFPDTSFKVGFYNRSNGGINSYSFESDHIELKTSGAKAQTISLVSGRKIIVNDMNRITVSFSVDGIPENKRGEFCIGLCESTSSFSSEFYFEDESYVRINRIWEDTDGIARMSLDVSDLKGQYYFFICLDSYPPWVTGEELIVNDAIAKIYSVKADANIILGSFSLGLCSNRSIFSDYTLLSDRLVVSKNQRDTNGIIYIALDTSNVTGSYYLVVFLDSYAKVNDATAKIYYIGTNEGLTRIRNARRKNDTFSQHRAIRYALEAAAINKRVNI